MRRAIALAAALSGLMLSSAFAADSRNVTNKPVPEPARVAVGDRGMAILSAAINSDGSIARGEGVTASGTTKLGTGVYEVGFGRDITECTYQLTAGDQAVGSGTPRQVGITQRSGNPNGVFLQIRDNANTLVDNGFFVLVYCGR